MRYFSHGMGVSKHRKAGKARRYGAQAIVRLVNQPKKKYLTEMFSSVQELMKRQKAGI